MKSERAKQKEVVMCVIGTRPEMIKMAPLIQALRDRPEEPTVRVVCTGQHKELLDDMVAYFGVEPDANLEVMGKGSTLAQNAALILERLDAMIEAFEPTLVVGQGDTTSAMCAALAAFYRGVRFAHVEAGLRSPDISSPFPEEGHRRLISALTWAHFAPTQIAVDNLLAENVPAERIFRTGNTVIDALEIVSARKARCPEALKGVDAPILLTLHRRENHGEVARGIFTAIRDLARYYPEQTFVYPVHPNPAVKGMAHELLGDSPNVLLTAPMSYGEFVYAMKHARFILTDSGGIQEEAPSLDVPVFVLRTETERPEGITAGAASLVGTQPAALIAVVAQAIGNPSILTRMKRARNPYGDGLASARCAEVLMTGALREPFGTDDEIANSDASNEIGVMPWEVASCAS